MQDFGELSEPDFVQLMGELLGAEWKMRLHRFPRGPDGGVDLRGSGPTAAPLHLAEASQLVVQCKHWPRAVLRDLKRELTREAQKDIVKQADRYILVTSARLTLANKIEIASSIYEGRISENDVLGREDIDDLLRNHPEVIRTNIKMFLASGSHLQAFRRIFREAPAVAANVRGDGYRKASTSNAGELQHMHPFRAAWSWQNSDRIDPSS
jgi:Restriction endonuclease